MSCHGEVGFHIPCSNDYRNDNNMSDSDHLLCYSCTEKWKSDIEIAQSMDPQLEDQSLAALTDFVKGDKTNTDLVQVNKTSKSRIFCVQVNEDYDPNKVSKQGGEYNKDGTDIECLNVEVGDSNRNEAGYDFLDNQQTKENYTDEDNKDEQSSGNDDIDSEDNGGEGQC